MVVGRDFVMNNDFHSVLTSLQIRFQFSLLVTIDINNSRFFYIPSLLVVVMNESGTSLMGLASSFESKNGKKNRLSSALRLHHSRHKLELSVQLHFSNSFARLSFY